MNEHDGSPLAKAGTLALLVLIALGLYKWQGFEVTVIMLLVFIWNVTPTARDIREVIERTKPKE